MRLLFATPAYPPFTGGGERYARSLALELARRGHSITVVTSDARAEPDFWRSRRKVSPGLLVEEDVLQAEDGPLTIVRCPIGGLRGGRRSLLAWRKLMVSVSAMPGDQTRLLSRMARRIPPIHDFDSTLADRSKPDLVIGFNLSWEYPALAGWRLARQHGLPFVLVPFAHLGEGQKTRMARNNMMDHQKRMVANADKVLALTEAEVEGFSSWGIPVQHMKVVGSGLDPRPALSDVVVSGALKRARLRPPFAIFVGRVTYDKGAIHAAQAVLALRQEGFPATLALVGGIAPDFSRFYNALDPAEREAVRPLGVLSETDKHSLLRQAQMLLLPSRTDSFGIVLLEAWIHETPVVGARVGGIASVIQHEEDGLLLPFGDVPALAAAIRRLSVDQALNHRLGAQGRNKVLSRYTWERVADQVLDQILPLVPQDTSAPAA